MQIGAGQQLSDGAVVRGFVAATAGRTAQPVFGAIELADLQLADSFWGMAAGDLSIPLGATGLAQCYELTHQLRGTADARQVDGARVALQHNLGLGGACVVTMYAAA